MKFIAVCLFKNLHSCLYTEILLALGQKYFVLRQNNCLNVLFAFHIKINAKSLGFWVFCEDCSENHWIPSDITCSHSLIKYYMSTLQWGMQWIYLNSSLFG